MGAREPVQPGPEPGPGPEPEPEREREPEPEPGKRSPGHAPRVSGYEIRAERGERSPGRADDAVGHEIGRIATAQGGSITRAQLIAVGLDDDAIDWRARHGSLHRVHRGVYLVGHEALAPLARERAALLAAGGNAVISHSSAAVVWALAARPDPEVHITLTAGRRRSRPGLSVHRGPQLEPLEIRRVRGMPVTSPARTLLDLAATRYPDLDRAFADAHAQSLIKPHELAAAIERASPRRGVRALKALINDNASGYTRSQAERLLRRLIRDANLPEPRFNVRFRQYELDAVWPEQRLVFEVDGYSYHGHRAKFESDRRKDMALTAAGYRVIRVTWRQLTGEPLAVVAVIATALGRGRLPG